MVSSIFYLALKVFVNVLKYIFHVFQKILTFLVTLSISTFENKLNIL